MPETPQSDGQLALVLVGGRLQIEPVLLFVEVSYRVVYRVVWPSMPLKNILPLHNAKAVVSPASPFQRPTDNRRRSDVELKGCLKW